ncbi:MAG: PEP-CTERM-box response regulator transcription factor [Chthoniobacterales bacterium]|nr:PEP-CTERM-box response regulator transcription factor [Chthoniobacterales bacterium]
MKEEPKPKLLLVDDDEEIRTQMKWALGSDYDLSMAGDRAEAVQAFGRERPGVVLLDLGLPPKANEPDEGLATLDEIITLDALAKVIIISGQGEKQNAIRAVGAGAYDFLVKPIEMEELKLVLRRAVHVVYLEHEHRRLREETQVAGFEGMVGASSEMQGVFAYIRKVAGTTAPVLLLGESGTGKELAALAIHQRSSRKDGPFIAINCNGIPESLLESELFGHEKGAFTGAHVQRKGLIESASGGTLFLDEVGELPPPIQVKLLRFLQEQTVQRVGGRQEIQIDTRVIAATNADLKQGISAGKFREDLYFRLAVVVIRLPALRDRGDDVAVLAREFLQRYAAQNNKRNMAFSPDAKRALYRHNWSGNVRELQNRVKRAVIMADGKRLTAEDLELTDLSDTQPATLREARDTVEKEVVQSALRRHQGKITSAAAELGISRPTLYELMERLRIPKADRGQEETD